MAIKDSRRFFSIMCSYRMVMCSARSMTDGKWRWQGPVANAASRCAAPDDLRGYQRNPMQHHRRPCARFAEKIMRFSFTPDQLLLRDNVKTLLARRCTLQAVRTAWDAQSGTVPAAWSALAESGVLGMTASE